MAQYDLVNMVSMVMLHILLEIIYNVRDTGRTRGLFVVFWGVAESSQTLTRRPSGTKEESTREVRTIDRAGTI